jgi:hypothetical protein
VGEAEMFNILCIAWKGMIVINTLESQFYQVVLTIAQDGLLLGR